MPLSTQISAQSSFSVCTGIQEGAVGAIDNMTVGAVYNACDVLVMQVCFICVTGGFEHSQCLSRLEKTYLGSDMRSGEPQV